MDAASKKKLSDEELLAQVWYVFPLIFPLLVFMMMMETSYTARCYWQAMRLPQLLLPLSYWSSRATPTFSLDYEMR